MSLIIKVTLSGSGLRLENITPNAELCCSCLLNFCGYGPFLLCGWHWLKDCEMSFLRVVARIYLLWSRDRSWKVLLPSSADFVDALNPPFAESHHVIFHGRQSSVGCERLGHLQMNRLKIELWMSLIVKFTLLSFCGNPFQDVKKSVYKRRLQLLRQIWRLVEALECHTAHCKL